MTSDYNCATTTFIAYFDDNLFSNAEEDPTPLKIRFANLRAKRGGDLLLTCLHRVTKNIKQFPEYRSHNREDELLSQIKITGYRLSFWDAYVVNLGVFDKTVGEKRIYLTAKIDNKFVRRTQTISVYSDVLNETATNRSLPANFCHALDAAKRRQLIWYGSQKNGIFSIHDEY